MPGDNDGYPRCPMCGTAASAGTTSCCASSRATHYAKMMGKPGCLLTIGWFLAGGEQDSDPVELAHVVRGQLQATGQEVVR